MKVQKKLMLFWWQLCKINKPGRLFGGRVLLTIMSKKIILTFGNTTDYTYDSDLVEIDNGQIKLKDLTPDSATFASTFTNNENGNWGDGTLTGTLTNATVSGGKLDCTGETEKHAKWNSTDNITSGNAFTVIFDYIPDYSGAPTTAKNLIYQDSSSNKNKWYLRHRTNKDMRIILYDKDGTKLIDNALSDFDPTSGTIYRFQLNVDIESGATALYIDDTQIGSTITDKGERDSTDLTDLFFGGYTGTNSDGYFDNLICFSSVQSVGEVDIPETRYSTDNPGIEYNESFTSDRIIEFTETSVKSGSDEIKAIVKSQNTWYYTDGSTLTASSETYATASEISAWNTYFDLENYKIGDTNYIKWFLHSADGSTTPIITQFKIEYFYKTGITNLEEIKSILGITSETYDDQIDTLRPLCEQEFFEYTNNYFKTDIWYESSNIYFEAATDSTPAYIKDSDEEFVSEDFHADFDILVEGSYYNDSVYPVDAVSAGILTIGDSADTIVDEDNDETHPRITLLKYPRDLPQIIASMVWEEIKKNQNYGIKSESYQGYSISIDLESGYSQRLIKKINKYKMAKVII